MPNICTGPCLWWLIWCLNIDLCGCLCIIRVLEFFLIVHKQPSVRFTEGDCKQIKMICRDIFNVQSEVYESFWTKTKSSWILCFWDNNSHSPSLGIRYQLAKRQVYIYTPLSLSRQTGKNILFFSIAVTSTVWLVSQALPTHRILPCLTSLSHAQWYF